MLPVVVLFVVLTMIFVSIVGFMQHFGIFPIMAFARDAGEQKNGGGGEVNTFHEKGM